MASIPETRHVEVHHDDVRFLLIDQVERFGAVRSDADNLDPDDRGIAVPLASVPVEPCPRAVGGEAQEVGDFRSPETGRARMLIARLVTQASCPTAATVAVIRRSNRFDGSSPGRAQLASVRTRLDCPPKSVVRNNAAAFTAAYASRPLCKRRCVRGFMTDFPRQW